MVLRIKKLFKQLFKKKSTIMKTEWNESMLNNYIKNGIEENINLDYKSAGSLLNNSEKKREISKDVSAFANSDGGLIIYGISEYNEKDKRHLPEKIDPISRLDFSKEWLEQVIMSNISPKIKGLKIHTVSIGANTSNNVVFVVEIPKGTTAFQAKDKKYYKRYNFESVAMEDYEIKDIINRANKPKIELRLIPKRGSEMALDWINDGRKFTIKTRVEAYNKGGLVAKYLEVFICGDSDANKLIFKPNVISKDNFQLRFTNENTHKIEIKGNNQTIGVSRFPILPNISYVLGELEFNSQLILQEHVLEFIVSTESSSSKIVLKGKELLGVIK